MARRARMRRREFLKTTGLAAGVAATGLESIVAARRAPAHAQGTRLHILRWVDFIPEADVELKRQAPEASKALGAEVVFEFINFNDLQPRITAAIQSGAGADIIMMLYNWPHLYASALVDVSDVAEPIGKAQKGYYDVFNVTSKVDGKWLAVPHGIVGNAIAYRRSWHTEIGVKEFPQTWDEWREVGKKLKAKGKPVGQALGHSAGDPPTFAYPLLWSFGGAEVDRTGKKVVINSKGAVEAVKFMQAFWKDACDEGGLAWDDTSNNRAFHSGEISATLNGASIYIVAKRQREKIRDEKGEPMVQDIEHAALLPKGPVGREVGRGRAEQDLRGLDDDLSAEGAHETQRVPESHRPRRRRRGDGPRVHRRRAPGAGLRAGDTPQHPALGRLRPGVRRGAQASGGRGLEGARRRGGV